MPRLVDDELFGRTPDGRVQDPDLIEGGLRSKSFATVVDLLGYGEISGFRNSSNTSTDVEDTLNIGRDIFLDGTPLVNANGDNNFEDVEVFFRSGTENQTPLSSVDSFGPDRIENTISVNSAILEDFPVSKTITGIQDSNGNELIKILRVTVQIPSLQEFVAGGDIRGTEVKISINIIENDGTLHNVVVEDSINGKATSPYLKDYEIDLEQNNLQFPLTVTVIRNTPNSTETTLQNSTNFLSVTTIITESQAYAGFAYVALRFNAQAFQSFPKRMYRIKGTKIQIPTGTTVDLDNGRIIYPDSYTFDGTFQTEKAWCSDPAWILYDLLTTDKGFGGTDGIIDADTLDVYSFYSASAYASTEITDPITDTTEPRFSCNVILNQRKEAYTLINDLCSVMNAMPFYSNGSLQISQDRPTNVSTNTSDPQYIFNNSNVTEEGFTYQGVGQRTKYTEVEVAYFDNDTQSIDYELITTADITALSDSSTKFGKTRKTLKAFACTSRGQANRLGRWFLYSNLKESEVVSFTTTLEAGVIVRPSTIIAIADSLRAGVRRGGRIKSVTDASTIVVDDANNTDLTTENSATLSVVLSDGSVESRSISSISGTTITVSSAFSSAPLPNSVWAIENTSVNFQIYRVVSIEEKNDSEYTITAVIHDTNKYAQVEDADVAVNRRPITTLLDEKPSPSNPSAIEQIVELNNRAVSKIFLSWEPVQGVKEYLVEFQFDNDNPERLRVARPSFELFESRLGSYTFKIKSYNTLGKLSASTTTVNLQAVGKTAPPLDVQNVQIEPLTDQFIRLRFDKSTDVDVIHGGNIIIRSSNLTTGASFTDSVDVIPELAGNISETIVSNIVNGTYFLAFRDDGGRISANAASITNISTQPDIFPKITVLTDREDTDGTPFNGTKVRCFFDNTLNGLVLSSVLLDSVTDFNAIDDFNQLGNSVDAGGTYAFANTLDLGGKQPVILQRHLVTKGFYFNELFDDRLQNINTWTDFNGTTVAIDVNAKLLVATTDLDPDTSTAGTYTINNGSGSAGTIITISKSSHGYSAGSFVTVDFTSGTGVDGDYQIQTVPDSGTFTLTSATSLSTSGNCNFSADFSQFNPFINGKYIARGFKFRCDMVTKDVAQSIEIEELGYTAQIESRTETSLGNAGASAGGFIASGTSTKSVTFTDSFFTGQSGTSIAANSVLPSIGITIENQSQGDFFVLSNITGTGFDIDVKDSGGNNVNRNFKYSATGFGRGS